MNYKPEKGILDYHAKRRLQGTAFRYRLERRSFEVEKVIRKYACASPYILDVGTSDGLMLGRISSGAKSLVIGIDISFEILSLNTNRTFYAIQADALALPFSAESFDVIIATAVIEHVVDGRKLIDEFHRVLKREGICVLTTPVPFFDRLADLLERGSEHWYPKSFYHHERFSLRKLHKLLINRGFTVLEARKFMISPSGFPFDIAVEGILRRIRLNFMFLNQLIVGRKTL